MIIYKITNKINNKSYIGQTTVSLHKRWQRHCWASESKKSMPIVLAIAKYGKDNFVIESLIECKSQAELDEKEIYYAKFYKTFSPFGYNLRAGKGRGSVSEETRKKLGLSNKGKKRTEETKRRLSASHLGNKMSDFTKAKLSKINKGKRPPNHVRLAAIRHNEKCYIIVCPNGEQLHIINMKNFCKLHELSPSKMCLVAQGKRKHHKHYRACYE
jgi:group I intron endonuclease